MGSFVSKLNSETLQDPYRGIYRTMQEPYCRIYGTRHQLTCHLQCVVLVLKEALEPVLTKLTEVQNNHAQCYALAEEFKVGLTEISGLVRVILLLLKEPSSYRQCNGVVESSLSFLLYSLAEIETCMHSGANYVANCSGHGIPCLDFLASNINPNLSTSSAFCLFQNFSFCLNLVRVGFYRFIINLRMLDILENPVGCDISDVAEEFCNCEPFDLFEWCARSCRPVLKPLSLELGEQVLQHPHQGMDYLWLQLREARAEHARCSLWMQVLEAPSVEPSDSLPLKVNFEDVQIGKLLGQGSFGSVFQCKWHDEDMVVKIIPMDLAASEQQEKFEMEVSILWSLRHPNVVRTFGYGSDVEGNGYGFIVMEQMEMALDKIIRDVRRDGESHVFPINVSMDLMSQIVEGMCALRAKRVLHRDLKPGNVLVNRLHNGIGLAGRVYEVKLADFGTSKQHGVHNSVFNTVKVGTPAYMAPEVICAVETGKQGYSWEADVYSFGMVCSEILTGERPFQHLRFATCKNVLAATLGGERPYLPLDDEDPLRRLIEDCWRLNPNERPDVWEIRRRLSECRLQRFFMTERPPTSWKCFHGRLVLRYEKWKPMWTGGSDNGGSDNGSSDDGSSDDDSSDNGNCGDGMLFDDGNSDNGNADDGISEVIKLMEAHRMETLEMEYY